MGTLYYSVEAEQDNLFLSPARGVIADDIVAHEKTRAEATLDKH